MENIPNIQMNGNELVVETFEIPIRANGEEAIVKVKKLTAGERRDISKKCLKTQLVGAQMTGDLDMMSFQIQSLALSIVDAPFPHSLKDIENLPEHVLDYLYKEYSKVVGDPNKKKD